MAEKKPVIERIDITPDELLIVERHLSIQAHVKRYRFARPFAHGRVLDCACGNGYGTFLLQQNPDVKICIGIDNSADAIDFAKKNYLTNRTKFHCADISNFEDPKGFDVLISLETIEHLDNPEKLVRLAVKNKIREILISFPAFKSTHFNPHHFHDFGISDIKSIFAPNYEIFETYDYLHEVIFVHLKAPK